MPQGNIKLVRALVGDYELQDRKNRPLAAFNPTSNKVEIDIALATIAPIYNTANPDSQNFQAFINDIFRVAKNKVNFYTIKENISYLRSNTQEAEGIRKTICRC